jgi:hypothetical protein
MPLNPPTLASGFIAPNLLSVAHIGIGMPKLALAIAIGACQFLTIQAKVVTTDTGVLGAGTSVMPLVIPSPLLQGGLYAGFSSMGILGIMSPLTILGITNGFISGFAALALLRTNHPGIGVGTGIAKIIGPSAIPSMLLGFASMLMIGEGSIKMATAIGIGLDTTFASFIQPVPIVGAGSPVGGAGVGFGSVI